MLLFLRNYSMTLGLEMNSTDRANILPVTVRRDWLENISTASVIFMIATCAILSNVLVIVLVSCDRQLRNQVSNFLIAYLAAVDTLTAIFVMVPSGIATLKERWPFLDIYCDLHCGFNYWCVAQTQMTICFLSIDRFISVRFPLEYRSMVTRNRVMVVLVFMSCIGCVPGIRPVLEKWVAYDYWEVSCQLDWYHYPELHAWSNGMYGSLFVLPSVTMIAANTYIVLAVRKSKSRRQQMSQHRVPGPGSLGNRAATTKGVQRSSRTNCPHQRTSQNTVEQHTAVNDLFDLEKQTRWVESSLTTSSSNTRRSNKNTDPETDPPATETVPTMSRSRTIPSLQGTRTSDKVVANAHVTYQSQIENKIILSIAVMTLCFFLCMSPFSLTKLMKMWTQNIDVLTPGLCLFGTMLQYSNSFVNPLIYGILRKDFRRAFYKVRARLRC